MSREKSDPDKALVDQDSVTVPFGEAQASGSKRRKYRVYAEQSPSTGVKMETQDLDAEIGSFGADTDADEFTQGVSKSDSPTNPKRSADTQDDQGTKRRKTEHYNEKPDNLVKEEQAAEDTNNSETETKALLRKIAAEETPLPHLRKRKLNEMIDDFKNYLDDSIGSVHVHSPLLKQIHAYLKTVHTKEQLLEDFIDFETKSETDKTCNLLATYFIVQIRKKASDTVEPMETYKCENLNATSNATRNSTGANEGEVTELLNVDAPSIELTKSTYKNGKREIYWCEEAIDMLQKLKSLTPSAEIRACELYGQAGCGKTTVAWFYANELREEQHVVWVSCEIATFSVVFLPKGLPRMYKVEKLDVDRVRDVLRNLPTDTALFIDGYNREVHRDFHPGQFTSSEYRRYILTSMQASAVTKQNFIERKRAKVVSQEKQKEIILNPKCKLIKERFLRSLPKEKLTEALNLINEGDPVEQVIETLVDYKQYYSGYSFRWLLTETPEAIIDHVQEKVKTLQNMENIASQLIGTKSSATANTIIFEPERNDYASVPIGMFVSRYCRDLFSQILGELSDFAKIAKVLPEADGYLAEKVLWQGVQKGELRVKSKQKGVTDGSFEQDKAPLKT